MEGNLPPSALVPFCSYQGDTSLLGRELPEMDNVTVCDKFQPIILEGQLCYSLDIASLRVNSTKSGKSNGLLLIVDPEPYLLNQKDDPTTKGSKRGNLDFKVYVHTLAQYTTFGPGLLAMSALKKMTGTTSFSGLPDYEKKCVVHNREQCHTQAYLEQVMANCECIPWPSKADQVVTIFNQSQNVFHLTGPS